MVTIDDWTVIGSVAGVVGAIAAVVVIFKPSSSPPSAAASAVNSGTMSGGTVNNGTITNGPSDDLILRLFAAQGEQHEKLLHEVAARLNTKAGEEQAFSEGAVQSFFNTLLNKNIPRDQWPQAFGEITRHYLELQARIAAIPASDDATRQRLDQAEAARKSGALEEADRLLEQAADAALHELQSIQGQARDTARQAAAIHASRASLAQTRLDWPQAATLYQQAFTLRAGDVSQETIEWLLFGAGDAWVTAGQSKQALAAYGQARDAVQRLLASDPGHAEWQRDLSVSFNKIGDVLVAQGDLSGALKVYRGGLSIRQKLAASDPGHAGWQRDLSVSFDKIGDVLVAQGDLPGALEVYRDSLSIAQKLAASDPGHAGWQRDLSVSFNKIGNVLVAQGDLPGALEVYRGGLSIAQKLAASDPGNAEWQSDVAVSCWKIGTLAAPGLSKAEREALLRQGLAIVTAMAAKNQLTAEQQSWPAKFKAALAKG